MARGNPKRAKILTDEQVTLTLAHIAAHSRHPVRDKVRLLLSVKAGLRAKEIALVTWAMVSDAQGALAPVIELRNTASKGRSGGRVIPMHAALKEALTELRALPLERGMGADDPVIYSERHARAVTARIAAAASANWFHALYKKLGFEGASSHSGRRTFITALARRIVTAGGSLKDVQELAGHSSLMTTQMYISGSEAAKKKVMEMI